MSARLRTADQYSWLLEQHILPELGKHALGDIDPSMVRTWNARLAKQHPTTAAKAYRLLSSIMRSAIADEIVTRNPCQVKGAAVERSSERPVASMAEVAALAEAMPDHLRVAVLLGAWCQLRRGELLGLRRKDIDLARGTLTVELTRGPRMGGEEIVKAPKTDAGRRTVAIPGNVLPVVERHLEIYVDPESDAPFLVGEKGRALLVKSFTKAWSEARSSVGRTDLRLHDLRHAGLTWAAATGASLAELMRRAGHRSPVAALRYQHATDDRDRVLAEALAELSRKAGEGGRSDAAVAPNRESEEVSRIFGNERGLVFASASTSGSCGLEGGRRTGSSVAGQNSFRSRIMGHPSEAGPSR